MRYFDLSQPLYANCPGWPTAGLAAMRYEAICPNDGYNAERIEFNVHTGTHMDAPFHFFPEGVTIDQIPVEKLCGRALLIDLRGRIAAREPITPAHLGAYRGEVKQDDIVIFNTGWGKKRAITNEYYHEWPYLSGEGAQWLLERGVKGVCTDGLSMGGWYEGTGRPCHEALLGAGVWLLEELNIPDELMAYGTCTLYAFPVKLRGFSGAPVRAVAAVEEAE